MLVAVGGHSRKIGKTSVVAGLIRGLPEFGWTAVKITQHGHGKHDYVLTEETDAGGDGDSSRYLAAGARRSFWLRAAAGRLGLALPALREILAGSRNTILESNSVLEFVRPDLYLVVLDFSVADFKESTRRYLDRADAFALIEGDTAPPPWAEGVPLAAKPVFLVSPPGFTSPELTGFVRGG